jgi:proteic killer suppression protein
MIRSFKDKEAEKIFTRQKSAKLPEALQRVALRKLRMLNRAANRLEKLERERKGQHSIRINDQWRICFKWQDNDAFEVEIVDYH